MDLDGRTVLVTGGAGHVGAHLADRLSSRAEVHVADDLSVGDRERVPDGVAFHEVDVADVEAVRPLVADADVVFHLAVAEKDVSAGARAQFEANVDVTMGLIEAARDADVAGIAFTSSSTVYGERAPRPTPESHGPMAPISPYGAGKLAEEGLLTTTIESAEMHVWIARLANVVGPVFDGSVIPDFVEKLRADPDHLEILGDGRQRKSFVHVADTAAGLITLVEAGRTPLEVVNVGTPGSVSIDEVAEIVAKACGCDPAVSYTGGDRGWTGDVPRMELDVSRLQELGWEPRDDCAGAVRRAARQLVDRAADGQ